ncbi:hypothetical protein GCM10022279_13090 [Comamonas faecalis]|uniref:Uncharacterized protein n=1 Tax=Comamonas faecalis TaxID=1387849 RepID=A0ABP7R1Q7_9BURK
MKIFTTCAALALFCGLAVAQPQQAQPRAKAAATAAKPAAKTAKTAPKSARKAVVATATPAAAAVVAAVVADTPLTDEQRTIAQEVHTGRIPCELGAFVNIEHDAQSPGRFHVYGKNFKYHMTPVATSTGAVRMEDERAGAIWVQIANKSMLLNQKLGQRMADECHSAQQMAVVEAYKTNPPPSLIDALPQK